MKQVSFSFPAPITNSVAATQSWTTSTGAFVVINGVYSTLPAGVTDPQYGYVELPGIQRTIGIFSTGNLSGTVFKASGVDTNGRIVTASVAGASGGSSAATDAFATFTAEFFRINAIFASAIASSAFTVGTGATGSTRWLMTDQFPTPFAVQGTVITATIASITPQSTVNDPNYATSPTVFSHATGALTANTQFSYTSPVPFVRYIVTTNTSSGVGSSMFWNQAGV